MSLQQTKKFLTALKHHLEKTNQGFCFDESGRIWTRQDVDNSLNGFKMYKSS